ncbi:hypothetical protein ACS15_1442 [Ralstonia insidiosa]|jgi:hypothetical protein|uniref:Uncharacterized protein n=1 Tax=Ralstonia insidiosa TaxID=190721 RepID=A0AAC9BFF3_9RALS|nr:hypothetical protein ACS15_1442 [Ralstonia insidiosa]
MFVQLNGQSIAQRLGQHPVAVKAKFPDVVDFSGAAGLLIGAKSL